MVADFTVWSAAHLLPELWNVRSASVLAKSIEIEVAACGE